ncbi:hypothetical protein ED733_001293 [Metarhizium rileyi]|uniref:Uncharacterized protein n=1 Tax=Metarhizium rileyi (strain RCEF 4871) TaxID=1649241 RepID=A0A5C6G4R3_METRR|nr:hypothetical protein ED733_001293 [Metarhizium rileyi]
MSREAIIDGRQAVKTRLKAEALGMAGTAFGTDQKAPTVATAGVFDRICMGKTNGYVQQTLARPVEEESTGRNNGLVTSSDLVTEMPGKKNPDGKPANLPWE